ncbi:MAG: NAD(P)-dependent dehydrogenase, short-chain alcohol dehydrogenase family [Hyphomicrobiales bacterium]|nr:NAD(P)-dependent dehydrogenase, short-chain alcohol dehydrogenase family [Hyphomicrobiales bacterium]
MTEKFALVTGGGTGIGRAAALALAGAGFAVAIAGRRMDVLEAAAADIRATGARALPIACDVSKPEQVEALFARVKSEFGRLDLLFNNAGMGGPPSLLEDLPFEAWRTVVGVNLDGMFLCTQAAFRLMKAQEPMGGRIINNGSISAHTPRPNSIAYTATKHAVTGITKASSLDGRKYDIAVGQIDIGNAESSMADKMKRGVPQPDGSIRPEATMALDHVGKAVVAMASLPLETNVLFMTIKATKMPFEGRG